MYTNAHANIVQIKVITPDKALFSLNYYARSYFSLKTYAVGIH